MISTYTHGFSFLQKLEAFENFKSYKENQFKCKIKVLHSNKIGEYLSKEFTTCKWGVMYMTIYKSKL